MEAKAINPSKENVLSKRLDLDISFVDYNLTKLFRYI